jgi:hypothetical protein
MTGQQIYDFFVELVGDSPSDTWFYATVNAVKDVLEAKRQWEYLKKVDSSNVRSASDGWQTAKTLPSDFGTPIKVKVGTGMAEYDFVPFDRLDLKDNDGTCRLDLANNCFYFNGTAGETGTAYLIYCKATPDITVSTSPVFPSRLHPLLAYETAKRWFAKDQSERGLAWNDEHEDDYKSLLGGMEAWDDRIKATTANQNPYLENAPDLN